MAYEMRISDWSSDVCSSDLRRAVDPRVDAPVVETLGRQDSLHQFGVGGQAGAHHRDIVSLAVAIAERRQIVEQVGELDRKSVVLGKSVSVRVDLGGRRIIKKKKKEENNTTKVENKQK